MAEPAEPIEPDETPLDAGAFGAWLEELAGAIAGERDAEVACGTCTACCTASQFIHIGPDEHDALLHIPRELRFPAPGRPKGHVLLGYDEHGRCPMLVDGACSIYEHRPRTCRTYDCRVFPASGLVPDEPTKVEIARRAAHWRFEHPGTDDAVRHDAVRAAAAFLRDRAADLPAGAVPSSPTHLAVLATQVHEAFIAPAPGTGAAVVVEPALDVVRRAIDRASAG